MKKEKLKNKGKKVAEEKQFSPENEEKKEAEIQAEVPESGAEKEELSLEEQLEQLQKENSELKERRLRIAAEFENFRRRSFTEKSDWIKNATKNLVLEICDVMDNFERALHPEAKMKQEAFKKGIELIYKQIEDILQKEGVKKIEALDKDFDPNFHEALAHIPSEKKENKIVAIIQNGYLMNDKVIKAARVAVSNGKKSENKKEKK